MSRTIDSPDQDLYTGIQRCYGSTQHLFPGMDLLQRMRRRHHENHPDMYSY